MALRSQSRALPVQRPRTVTPDLGHLQDVEITASDGAVLRAAFVRSAGSEGCVLLLHGIADSRAGALGFAPMFIQAGYSVLAPDSRGHGSSGGGLITFGLLESTDVLRWASWLHEQGCQRLFGLGESLGASILIQAAAQKPVFSAIVAECAFSDLPSIAEYRISESMHGSKPLSAVLAKGVVAAGLFYARLRYGLDLNAASPVNSAKRLSTPLFLIHGVDDARIPPAHSRAIAESDPTAVVWFVAGAGHTTASAKEPAEFRMRVLGWFEKHRTSTELPRSAE